MEYRMVRPLLSVLAAVCIITAAAPSFAHPPWAPYDDTRFAPILGFGPKIGIETVVRAMNTPAGVPIGDRLVAPLKVVSTPSLPNHIFIVDQIGILWVVNLTTGNRTRFLDVTSAGVSRPERIITLGVCGDGTFDERGLLSLAFHPDYSTNGKFYTYMSELEVPGAATIPKAVPFDADHQNPGCVRRVPQGVATRGNSMKLAWPGA